MPKQPLEHGSYDTGHVTISCDRKAFTLFTQAEGER